MGIIALKILCFFGAKGGQLDDKGYINDLEVLDLKWDGDTLYHKVDGDLKDPITMHVDADTRIINTTVQTVFHILDGFFESKGIKIISVNADPNNQWFEVNTKDIDKDLLTQMQDYVQKVIDENIKVTFEYIDSKDYEDEFYRQFEYVRLVKIGEVNTQPCGTCHVRSTREIGDFTVLYTEKSRKGTKIHIAVNKVVGIELANKYKQLRRIAKIVDSSLENLEENIEKMLLQAKQDKKTIKELNSQLVEFKVKQIQTLQDDIICLEGENFSGIRSIAQSLMHSDISFKILYTKDESQIFFAVISKEAKAKKYLEELKKRAFEITGGGSEKIVTGKFYTNNNQNIESIFNIEI